MKSEWTEAAWNEMVKLTKEITVKIGEHQTGPVWDYYLKIIGKNIGRPCMCQSAAGEWKRAMETIREFVKTNGEQYNP